MFSAQKHSPRYPPGCSGCTGSPHRPHWQSQASGRHPQCCPHGPLHPPPSKAHRSGRCCRLPPQGPALPVPACGCTAAPCSQKRHLYNKNRGRDLFRCGRCGKQRSSNPPAPHCPPQPVRPAAAKPLPPRAGPARLPRQLLPPCKRHVVLWSSSSCSNQGFCIKPACFSKYSGFCTLIQSLFLNKKTVHAPHTDCFMV